MPQPQLDLAQLVNTFTAYCGNVTTLLAAFAIRDGYGDIPKYPIEVVIDTDYTSVTTTRATWTGLRDTNNGLIGAEFVGVNSAKDSVLLVCPPGTWVELSAGAPGDFAPYGDTVWIGYASAANGVSNTTQQLVVLEQDPIVAFPGNVHAFED